MFFFWNGLLFLQTALHAGNSLNSFFCTGSFAYKFCTCAKLMLMLFYIIIINFCAAEFLRLKVRCIPFILCSGVTYCEQRSEICNKLRSNCCHCFRERNLFQSGTVFKRRIRNLSEFSLNLYAFQICMIHKSTLSKSRYIFFYHNFFHIFFIIKPRSVILCTAASIDHQCTAVIKCPGNITHASAVPFRSISFFFLCHSCFIRHFLGKYQILSRNCSKCYGCCKHRRKNFFRLIIFFFYFL